MRLLDPWPLVAVGDAARETDVLEAAVFEHAGLCGALLVADQELAGDRRLDDVPRLLEVAGALDEVALGVDAVRREHVEPLGVAQVLAPGVEVAATAGRALDHRAQPTLACSVY